MIANRRNNEPWLLAVVIALVVFGGAWPGSRAGAQSPEGESAGQPPRVIASIDEALPLMSNPRREAYLQTAEQSVSEVVADLGNRMTLFFSTPMQNTLAYPSDMERWLVSIPWHIKVLRLIEEGRADPVGVAGLLRAGIQDCLDWHDEVLAARPSGMRAISKRTQPSAPQAEQYYDEHRRYLNAAVEYARIHEVVNASFYILANIDQFDATTAQQLYDWITKKKRPMHDCKGINAWFIDQYFQQNAGSDHADAHWQHLDGKALSGQTGLQARWTAPWQIGDPLVAMRNVDNLRVETIETLTLPVKLPVDDAVRDLVIENFRAHVESQ